jgi:metal-responsive CopG/Arc/MetJ family transcriptional regulator
MGVKQISVTMPDLLFDVTKEYSEEYGYRNVQELILDMLRKKVVMENVERYREIEERMEKGEGKRLNQKEALKYIKEL